MDTPDDFSNYPKSITELKAERDEHSHIWKPRDALVQFLRRLDSGEFPDLDVLIVIGMELKPNAVSATHYNVASPDIRATMGAMELCKMKMHSDASE